MKCFWLFRLFVTSLVLVREDTKSIRTSSSLTAVIEVVVKDNIAVFMVNITGPITYAKFGIAAANTLDLDPPLMRVDVIGVLTHSNYTGYRDRVEFIGNLSLGRAWFKLKNVSSQDKGTKLRIYYKEEGKKGPKKMDFKINIPKEPSTTHSPSTQLPSTQMTSTKWPITRTKNTRKNTRTTVGPPTTKAPSNSNGFPWKVWGPNIAVAVVFVVVVVAVVVKRKFIRRKYKNWRQTKRSKNGGEESEDLILHSCKKKEPDEKEQKLDHYTKRIVFHRSKSVPQEGSKDLVLDSCKKKEPDEKEQKFDHKTNTRVLHRCNSVPQSLDY